MPFENFPYTNFHDMNLNYLLQALRTLEDKVDTYMEYSTIKYADPLQWNITTQYEENTVVVSASGSAYLSTQPVPSGINITDTSYWTPIGNFSELWNDLKDSIASVDLGDTTTTPEAVSAGGLLWMSNTLYRATVDLSAGAQIIPDTNVEAVTVEAFVNDKMSAESQTVAEAIEEQNQTISDAVNRQDQAISDAITSLEYSLTNNRIKDHVRYYVNGSTGSDDNEGLSTTSQFKTLDRALKLSQTNTEVRIYLTAAGTYPVTLGDVCAGCSIHINSTTANVVVDFITNDNASTAIYQSHWNLQGTSASSKLSVDCHGADSLQKYLYFDNCLLSATYVDFLCPLRTYGGSEVIAGCSLNQFLGNQSVFSFSDGTTITNTSNTVTPLQFVQCRGRMIGTWSANELGESGSGNFFALFNASTVIIGSVVLPNLNTQYAGGLRLFNYSEMFITNARLTAINTRATNSISTDSVVYTDQGLQSPYNVRYYGGAFQYWNGSAWVAIS